MLVLYIDIYLLYLYRQVHHSKSSVESSLLYHINGNTMDNRLDNIGCYTDLEKTTPLETSSQPSIYYLCANQLVPLTPWTVSINVYVSINSN